MAKKKLTPEKLRKEIEKNMGNLSKISKALGVSKSTIYRWVKKDPALQKLINEVREDRKEVKMEFDVNAISDALIEEYGNISAVAKRLGMARSTLYTKIEQSEELQLAVIDAKETTDDYIENRTIREGVENGNMTALIFLSKTRLRKRGYIEYKYKEEEPEMPVDVNPLVELPASVMAPGFLGLYRDIRQRAHLEYVLHGGRGSTKSSFISFALIWLLINNPDIHVLSTRQIAATLRDSCYNQIRWAIDELGLQQLFKTTTNPLEITYIPTGQKFYFRGADDPTKIKSIKTPFGYIGALWFEELDQFHGQEAIRKVEQSAIRGGDLAFIFKSFNPPRAINNWANLYVKVPKDNQLQHESNYLNVPPEWLGQAFLDEAEHLKKVNPKAYEHEYLGVANGAGGLVFENIEIRPITDEEIHGTPDPHIPGEIMGGFDRVLHGLDFGYYPDPAQYVRCHYDAARMILYIFGELRRWKTNNKTLYNNLIEYGLEPHHTLICDSAEPKSIADLREYGLAARGAEKGAESVNYSIKWLQSLTKIVIDQKRAPYTADEFLAYEYEVSKDGEVINAYPDKNNHGIDAVRYATNFIWRKRGQ